MSTEKELREMLEREKNIELIDLKLTEKAKKWDKAYSGVYDDEMPFTPERISLVMNFVNDHFPDFDTPKEFEDMITEYTDWETELTEAEDKLEAVKTHLTKWSGKHSDWQMGRMSQWKEELVQILGESQT